MESNIHYQVLEDDLMKKIQGIEGLDELMAARSVVFNTDPYDLDSIKHEERVVELEAKYPRAAAYLKAMDYRWSAYPKQHHLGDRAVYRILEGEDYTVVIQEMEDAWATWQLAQEG